MKHEKSSRHHGHHHAERMEHHHARHEHHHGETRGASRGKVHTMHDGHKHEYHYDDDHHHKMHHDAHEISHGHRDMGYHDMHEHGGLPRETIYYGINGGSIADRRSGMAEVERDRKMEGGGRMARQHKQRAGAGMRDDTVYGKMPPVPGRIDS